MFAAASHLGYLLFDLSTHALCLVETFICGGVLGSLSGFWEFDLFAIVVILWRVYGAVRGLSWADVWGALFHWCGCSSPVEQMPAVLAAAFRWSGNGCRRPYSRRRHSGSVSTAELVSTLMTYLWSNFLIRAKLVILLGLISLLFSCLWNFHFVASWTYRIYSHNEHAFFPEILTHIYSG